MIIEIRAATNADESAVLDLVEELFTPPRGFPPGYTHEIGSAGFQSAVSDPRADVLLAFDGETLLGLASVYADILSVRFGPRCWLEDIVVFSERRGEGIGAQLIAAAREWAEAHGCNHLELSSGIGRVDAHRFYEREGMLRSAHYVIRW